MNSEAAALPVRTLHPLGRFVWQLAGAVISSFALIIVFSQLSNLLLELLLLCFTIGLPAVIGFIWVREVTLKRIAQYSHQRFRISVISTILSLLTLPVIAYRSILPRYLSEKEMRSFFLEHEPEIEKLVELHKKNPQMDLDYIYRKYSANLSNQDQEVRLIVSKLLENNNVTAVASERNPLRITIAIKVPRTLPFTYVDQNLIYAEKLDPNDLVVEEKVPLIGEHIKHRGVYKRIRGSWYLFLHEYGD